jgi:LmbE family N-acetylglucosaminyl deacetylase
VRRVQARRLRAPARRRCTVFRCAVAAAFLAASLDAVALGAAAGNAGASRRGVAADAGVDPSLEPFDPRADYGYDLRAADAVEHAVVLTAAGFAWPAAAAGDTAFLEIHLRRSRGEEPGLRATRGAVEVRQVFEAGARGRRFVDVSPLLAGDEAASSVALASEGAEWEPGPASLFVFQNPPVDGLRVLVLAPHPDDAEIAAFGLYSRADADVVTVTAGDAGGKQYAVLYPDDGEHYRVKGWMRTWDSVTVPLLGGVEPGRARNLGYYDATLARLWRTAPHPVEPLLASIERPGWYRELNVDAATRDRRFEATWPALVADLRAELERVRPRVVVAPHPLLDRHRDHRFSTLALLEALAGWDGACELWLYTNHAVQNEAWPFGPRSAMSGLPPWPGGELFWSRLVSHPLAPGDRSRKLIALEAMHDLRPFDLRDGSAPARTAAERARAQRYDYLRRAPRPNELFFVATGDDAARLHRFLADRARAERSVLLLAR